ncbi:MAG: hypothetical protein Q9225_004319 [Loekoesia sp. 1 TL-2023]
MANSTQDILRFIPSNTEAKEALSSLARLKDQMTIPKDFHEDHLKYLEITSSSTSGSSHTKSTRPRDETPDEDSNDDSSKVTGQAGSYEGYFRVHFDLPVVSNHLKWVIGRGSAQKFGPHRDVDILLAAPGSKLTRILSAAHVFLSINPTSGAWLLAAGAEIQVEDQKLEPYEKICLSRPKTRLKIVKLQYIVEFVDVDKPELEQRYLERRTSALEGNNMSIPATSISGIPSQYDIVFTSIVFRRAMGLGSHAEVFEGIDPKTGDLRVVKRITCKNRLSVTTTYKEVSALQRFSGHEGIVELLDWRTSLGDQHIEWTGQPIDVYLVHKKGIAFSSFYWANHSPPDWALRRSLCHQLLAGLKTIHAPRYMHRDITPQNIILFDDGQQSKAALSDFGKVCDRSHHNDTCLAAWKFLPPEVEKGKERVYNQKLAIWMLAFALILSWFPDTRGFSRSSSLTHSMHSHILSVLRQQEEQSAGLAHLLGRMLSWDAMERPTAATAYKHWCFSGTPRNEPLAKRSTSKRPH